MKSFLITFILSSVTLAASVPATTEACIATKLYRKRSKDLINIYQSEEGSLNAILHFETTDKDEKNDKYDLDRQIATICSNQATGTVPLYSFLNEYYGKEKFSFIQRHSPYEDMEIRFRTKIIGYVYDDPQGGASLKIFKKRKDHEIKGSEISAWTFLTTANEDEASQNGYNYSQLFFYSLPLKHT